MRRVGKNSKNNRTAEQSVRDSALEYLDGILNMKTKLSLNKGEILMNDSHKFGAGFGSDHAPEQSTPIVSHHDTIKWFEAIPGEKLCIRVHGTQVNGRYAIMENIASPGTATPMHFHAEDEIFHILEGTVTFSIDGDVFNASVGSIVVIPAGAHHAWRNRSNAPIRMSTFFSPGGVEELYPKLVGLSLEELSTVVEPFGSGIVGPPIDE
jgi:quercetin dioxygenase-like cupin family protein